VISKIKSYATVSFLFGEGAEPPSLSEVSRPSVRRDTKSIGDRSEAMVLAALVRNGYRCSIPFGENHRYDILADNGERIYRIQVKTGRYRNGVVSVNCCSSHQHRRNGPTSTRPYFGEVDFIGFYCPWNQKVYLLPECEFVRSTAHLRILPTANRQNKMIRWAAEFELL
jgi:hypothetical protein